jgi:hypothetical protein
LDSQRSTSHGGLPDFDWDGLEQSDLRDDTKRKFVCEDCDTLCGRDGEWLVKGLWPRRGVCYLAGPSMAGKSFLALELVSSVGRGTPVIGRRSLRSGVVYIASEGANGVRTRVEGLRNKVGVWSGHLQFIGDAPNLVDQHDVESLRRCLADEKASLQRRDIRLGMVVIDTLSASIPGADENSAKDMSPVLRHLQELAQELDACILIIAHVGKDAERGVRGWSGLVANADGVITVRPPDQAGTRLATIVKVKDGEAGEEFAFGLQAVNLRFDADGDQVTTCVVEWRDPPEPPARKTSRSSMRPAMHILMGVLGRLEDRGGTRPVTAPGAPPGTQGVTLKQFQDAALSDGFYGVEPDEVAERKRWRDARRKNFTNNLEYLVRDGHVRLEGGIVWRIHRRSEDLP